MDSNKIAQRLRELRQYKPRRVVAEEIGISESALTAYEMGTRGPRDEIKIKLADYYETTVEAIFLPTNYTECIEGCEKWNIQKK